MSAPADLTRGACAMDRRRPESLCNGMQGGHAGGILRFACVHTLHLSVNQSVNQSQTLPLHRTQRTRGVRPNARLEKCAIAAVETR